MLNIGVIGLGDIAQKAYLPVMRSMSQIKWYLCTRNGDTLKREANLMGRAVPCETLDALLQFPLDGVFIHVATSAHVEIAKRCLQQGIPVFIDKPVAEQLRDVQALYCLAKEHDTFLMAGFNRRFAPKVQELKEIPEKKRIVVEKNQIAHRQAFRYKLFDVFIHPLDTTLYLLDGEPIKGSFYYRKEDQLLEQCTVYIETQDQTAIISMNCVSGTNREMIEVQSTGGTYTLKNLTELTVYQGQDEIVERFDAWETTTAKRGFDQMIQAFLSALETKENPVPPLSSILSHAICERIALSKASEGFLSFKMPEL